ncbi:flagellar basal-body MS-ring/collar protein FliF [Ectobacillus antri]|jgi:flagellar M-ring protein FliF|uniref:Flagellar basal-body MS-ring/collar protein FliF n=1 Tax=Ectobacillus antri TaxID=2486280 RepID=A0ABT6H2L5_9BACI|nr:flagellar basal-body MS-ring/collar protein FliF [Ectobacillus antri]MDG4656195.1 flagellar basal-body MS-ring/collar protein FliF [Ectobacillus antri]MDG5752870.1 flagellar basal-body MS-ring/collar protein FliF [Ectobacillus antri]
MEKLKEIAGSLKSWHKMVIGAVLLAIVTSVSLYFTLPDNYAVLYKNLNETDQQEILAELSKLGVDYQLQEDGSIKVPDKDVVWVRASMRELGLPNNGAGGDDILLESSLGLSEQDKKMRQTVGIRKQLESDIVKNINSIETANVQLTLPDKESIFDEKTPSGTAAVTIGVRGNQGLTQEQILGIQYMVSAAVPGVKAEDVSIIDSKKGVISKSADVAQNASSSFEKELVMQRQIEERLKQNISETLVNLFQLNNFHVNTSVKVNYDEVTRQTEMYGDRSMLRSKQDQKEKSTATENSGATTEAGIAANGEVPNYNNNSVEGNILYNQDNSNTTENYEIDKTVETIIKHPELTSTNVVVWVDEETLFKRNMDANTFRQAIATAAGLQADANGSFTNGQVTVVPVDYAKQEQAKPAKVEEKGNNWLIISGIVAVVTALLLGAGGVYVMRRRKRKEEQTVEEDREDLFVIEDIPAHKEVAATINDEGSQEPSLDQQVQELAKENIDEAARVLKKWLNQ